jgi:hypothetical protein
MVMVMSDPVDSSYAARQSLCCPGWRKMVSAAGQVCYWAAQVLVAVYLHSWPAVPCFLLARSSRCHSREAY